MDNKGKGAEEKQTGRDNSLLVDEISTLFNSYFGEILNIISNRFPHVREDGSSNEAEFKGLRARILRCGNDKLRIVPTIMSKYFIQKEFDIIVETKDIQTPYKVRDK
ncbi:MAG: hypothetical protein M0P71_01395 [Melioribacteraceae bacterium]|nr:hypothetical protein [Melioribacteraceae bacterium]